eukprot:TRINITY_DN4747_c0_g1_i1.p1 TRINITY_DN4747_c0_g1~~TRINITY_DN4747_c0_g1_i1.p1  ORF type:complete len:144 (+),score=24.24 TRINITY_DN4747_c0_g1_i1:497-928(+)
MPSIQSEYSNLFLFGNEMIFKNNKLHNFEMNVSPFEKHKILKDYQKMKNTIVVGDALFDLELAKNFKSQEHVLKIGYFNDDPKNNKQLFDRYFNSYDVLITNDGNFQFVDLITRYIIQDELYQSIMQEQDFLDHYRKFMKLLI